MYSPKISEDLIPELYKLGKAMHKPMTEVVNSILTEYLSNVEIKEEEMMRNDVVPRLEINYKIIKNGN